MRKRNTLMKNKDFSYRSPNRIWMHCLQKRKDVTSSRLQPMKRLRTRNGRKSMKWLNKAFLPNKRHRRNNLKQHSVMRQQQQICSKPTTRKWQRLGRMRNRSRAISLNKVFKRDKRYRTRQTTRRLNQYRKCMTKYPISQNKNRGRTQTEPLVCSISKRKGNVLKMSRKPMRTQ